MFRGTLIRSGNNAKTIKGDGEFETAIMYLAPARLSGHQTCPMAVMAKCEAGCLNTAGRGRMSNVQIARINKTKRYFGGRDAFMAELVDNVAAFVRYCQRKGVKPAVRLNGTSDIQWEVGHPVTLNGQAFASIFAAFPEVEFYDYTKITKRAYRQLPANYRLVLSYSEANPAYAADVIKTASETGLNVAVVYRTKADRDAMLVSGDAFGDSSQGVVSGARIVRPVIDGDSDDMRFLDPHGVIVGLYAKGAAKQDRSGFVVG